MISNSVFPGRVIFDHLAKTAGMAINSWLLDTLGSGCVSPNLEGNHRDLIKLYGGLYSVISAHIIFNNAEGLDPRYQYITLLRDPVERTLSWLRYLANNNIGSQSALMKEQAIRILESEGTEIPDAFIGAHSNMYVEHFCRINGNALMSDDEKVANAFTAIQQYDVVGLYTEMPRFIRDVAALIDFPPPTEIPRVNVTIQSPRVAEVPLALRRRVEALDQLDLRLYEKVVAWKATCQSKPQLPSMSVSKWSKYEPARHHTDITTDEFTISHITLREKNEILYGQLMTFEVEFYLTREVTDLVMGIHIFDSDGYLAFGSNSTFLNQSYRSLANGKYRANFQLVANLPAGKYSAGFCFLDYSPEGQRELARHNDLCKFHVHYKVGGTFTGYAYLSPEIGLNPIQIHSRHFFPCGDQRLQTHVGLRIGNSIATTGQAGCLIFGPYIPLKAGQYQVILRCTLGENGLAGARVDVVADKGNRVLAERAFEEPDEDGCFVVQPVSLNAPCDDLEVRVWVTDKTDLQISMIEIDRCLSKSSV